MQDLLSTIDARIIQLAVGILILAIAVLIGWKLVRRSSWARTRRAVKEVRIRKREYAIAAKVAHGDEERVSKLRAKSERVKPRKLWEAEEELAESIRAAQRARDEVKVAERDLQRTIEAEYPPSRQERLLRKYLPERY